MLEQYWTSPGDSTLQSCGCTATYHPSQKLSPELLNQGPGGPASLGHVAHSSIFSPTDLNFNCSIGDPEGPVCWVLVFSTTSYLQLIELPVYRVIRPPSCGRPPSSCGRHKSHSFNPSTVKVIFWYSSTGCTSYLKRCISFFESPAGSEVNIQQPYYHLNCVLMLN